MTQRMMARTGRLAALALLLILLGACGRVIPPSSSGAVPTRPAGPRLSSPRPSFSQPPLYRAPGQPPIVLPNNALTVGVTRAGSVEELPFTAAAATAALTSFRESCPRLLSRKDASGLTRGSDWNPSCAAASDWPAGEARAFFARYFEAARIGDGRAFVTGYYEPEIAGVRDRQPGFDVPVYAVPPDLVRARVGDAPPLPDGRQPIGRYDESGRFLPYFTRAEIEDGALAGRGLEIAWAADRAEFYFLQVQGSGRLRAPDGRVMRIGYAAQNGLASRLIGSIMRERGLIGSGPGQYSGSLEGIKKYLREFPEEGREMLRANQAYVFFRETTGADPLGALGVPVRARSSAAADPQFVPLGAPVWLSLDRDEPNGLWIAQDTGGAIKGANRFDTFWGAGNAARAIAGGMSARGRALLLLPRGTLDRLGAR